MNNDIEIRRVSDVLEIVDPNKGHLEGLFKPGVRNFPHGIWFRGQQNKDWRLEPSVFRKDKNGKVIYSETNMFFQFQLRQSDYRQIYHSKFDWLCLMQHYGLPTRLLDWSESILVALYFAVDDSEATKDKDAILFALGSYKLNWHVSFDKIGNIYVAENGPVIIRSESVSSADLDEIFDTIKYNYPDGQRLIEATNKHDPVEFKKRLAYPVSVYPGRLNNRMTFQESVFTIHGGSYQRMPSKSQIPIPAPLDDFNENLPDAEKFLKSFTISKKYKSKIKSELNRIGIHEGTLFPELEYQASYLKEKWKL